jgi:uncharacterized protein YgiM (DUF1202 family)
VIQGPRVSDGLSWLQVQTPEGTGWSAENYLKAAPWAEPSTPRFAAGDHVVVATDAINLREKAGVEAEVVGSLGTGMMAEIVEGPTAANNLNWFKLESDAGSGWSVETFLAMGDAAAAARTFGAGERVYVSTDALNLRAAAKLDGDVVFVLYTGDGGIVTDGPTTQDGTVWYQIETAAGTGWSAAQYLGKGSADPAGRNQLSIGDTVGLNTDGINVRSGPGTSNEMVIIMLNGEEADVVDGPKQADGYDWYKLSNSRGEGWGVADYLEVVSAGAHAVGDDVKVIDGELNLRADIGTGADVVAILPDGAFVEIVEGPETAEGYDWYRVTSSRYGTGWSVGEYLAGA